MHLPIPILADLAANAFGFGVLILIVWVLLMAWGPQAFGPDDEEDEEEDNDLM